MDEGLRRALPTSKNFRAESVYYLRFHTMPTEYPVHIPRTSRPKRRHARRLFVHGPRRTQGRRRFPDTPRDATHEKSTSATDVSPRRTFFLQTGHTINSSASLRNSLSSRSAFFPCVQLSYPLPKVQVALLGLAVDRSRISKRTRVAPIASVGTEDPDRSALCASAAHPRGEGSSGFVRQPLLGPRTKVNESKDGHRGGETENCQPVH